MSARPPADRSGRQDPLAGNEHLFRDLLERQGEAFGVVDEEERFLLANRVAEDIFGVGPGELEGRSLLDFLEPPEATTVRAQTHLREAGERGTYDLVICRPTGERRIIQLTATPRKAEEGRFAGTVGVFRDITEQRALEEAMFQAQKMESLGLLAGGIAHDFNNLLTALLGNLNLAQARLAADHPASASLEKVEQIAMRAAELTRQMLAYSGKGRFHVRSLDLTEVVTGILPLLEVSLPKGVRLDLDLARGLPAIEADTAQVQQVVMNLVSNAAEAIGDEEGRITVATAAVPAPDEPDLPQGPCVRLEVSDSGCGMAPEVAARIFDPFFSTKGSGRGLGLSALQGILRGHRAGLRVASTPGQGTRFQIYFPARSFATPAAAVPARPKAPRFHGRILLVDDEPSLREATGELLGGLGFKVITEPDGLAALGRLSAEDGQVDLVIMDVTMPRMDGHTAFQAMHARWPLLPVILSSGYDQQTALGAPEAQGLAGYLPKPYRLEDLIDAVRHALEPPTGA